MTFTVRKIVKAENLTTIQTYSTPTEFVQFWKPEGWDDFITNEIDGGRLEDINYNLHSTIEGHRLEIVFDFRDETALQETIYNHNNLEHSFPETFGPTGWDVPEDLFQ